ncbi:hypothetical protein L218DRAFT_940427 [Marasmius fiardii PR-910]|nr:hypothetical protein L218DRAFT_940427 [Marasmius fiardii PR-910]
MGESSSSNNSQANGDLKHTSKSEKYFLNGGDIYFLVGGCYFRVHSYFFLRESPTFERFLMKHIHNGRGDNVPNAIQIHQVTAQEFERFLWVFYNPIHGIYNAPVEDWKSILRLADMWCFTEVKALAVRELQKLDMLDVDRIALYQDCAVDEEHIFLLILRLCQRDYNLTYPEAQKVGMSTAVLVYQGREILRAAPGSGGKSPLPTGFDEQEAQQTLRDLLKDSSALRQPKTLNGFNGVNGAPLDFSKGPSNDHRGPGGPAVIADDLLDVQDGDFEWDFGDEGEDGLRGTTPPGPPIILNDGQSFSGTRANSSMSPDVPGAWL